MKFVKTAAILILGAGWQVHAQADEILTVYRDGVFQREIDVSGWEQDYQFISFSDQSGTGFAYPWTDETKIDYVIEDGRLTVNGKVVGVNLDDIQGRINPADIITLIAPSFLFDQIKTYPNLAALTISGYLGEDTIDLSYLTELSDLRSLHFNSGGGLDSGQIKAISQCSELVTVNFGALILPVGAMKDLHKLENLRNLSVAAVSDQELSYLAGHPNLRSISRMWTGPGPDWVDIHKTLPQLQELTIIQAEIALEVFTWLAQSNKLTSLSLPYAGVYDEKVEYIGKLTNLEYLDLYHTEVADDDVIHLANLKNLRTLHLGGYELIGHGAKHLAGMDKLRVLEISVDSSAVALDYLKDLYSLRHLILAGSVIYDVGISKLKNFKKLRILDLTGTEVTEDVVADLQKALPTCIIRNSY